LHLTGLRPVFSKGRAKRQICYYPLFFMCLAGYAKMERFVGFATMSVFQDPRMIASVKIRYPATKPCFMATRRDMPRDPKECRH
jgi:hypothetical protein